MTSEKNETWSLREPFPVGDNRVQGRGYEVMKDIEQDQDVHGDPLSGHICQDHNQKDGAEEENEDEVVTILRM